MLLLQGVWIQLNQLELESTRGYTVEGHADTKLSHVAVCTQMDFPLQFKYCGQYLF